MKNIIRPILLSLLAVFSVACSNEDLKPFYEEQKAGKIVIRSYNALKDSVQVIIGDEPLEINKQNTFSGKIVSDYQFVYYANTIKNFKVVNKTTGELLKSYEFTGAKPVDTLSLYMSENILIDRVLSFKPGVLSATGNTGYKFIFPTLNRYSASGYNGPIDAIVRNVKGEVLGTAENITPESFSTFVEFPYASPPILQVELVKHGTTESYVSGRKVIVQLVMQTGKSGMIVLDENANESGAFIGVKGSINLVDFFDY